MSERHSFKRRTRATSSLSPRALYEGGLGRDSVGVPESPGMGGMGDGSGPISHGVPSHINTNTNTSPSTNTNTSLYTYAYTRTNTNSTAQHNTIQHSAMLCACVERSWVCAEHVRERRALGLQQVGAPGLALVKWSLKLKLSIIYFNLSGKQTPHRL